MIDWPLHIHIHVLVHRAATILGPPDTPFEGGIFSLRVTFGQDYPEKPPKMRFLSEMFHPNSESHRDEQTRETLSRGNGV